jgi:hypothetical protein
MEIKDTKSNGVTYEEKFIVINRKHLKEVPSKLEKQFTEILRKIRDYIPKNKYIVCNQDEPYAKDVLSLILAGEVITKILSGLKNQTSEKKES